MDHITSTILEDIQKLSQDQKLVEFEDLKRSESLLEQLAEEQEDKELQTLLEELDPSFVLYMNMIECLMIISSITRKHRTLNEFNKNVAAAEKKFTPGTWQSSVTESFFNMWLLFDVPVQQDLSLGKLCYQVAHNIGSLKTNLKNLIEKGITSRFGVYKVKGSDQNHVHLSELVTNREITAICPTGYLGQVDEIWLVRIFPPIEHHSNSIIVTTPYCICNADEEDWLTYFASKGIKSNMLDVENAMDRFMKESSQTQYWLDYIHSTPPSLEKDECIHLSGVPKN